MHSSYQYSLKLLVLILGIVGANTFAQEAVNAKDKNISSQALTTTSTTGSAKAVAGDAKADDIKTADAINTQPATKTQAGINPQPAKKMVQDATINLQTTITGNQEQPRVLYILPWQSPQTSDIDFEPIDNLQKVVFGHVEREELRRELEASGEIP